MRALEAIDWTNGLFWFGLGCVVTIGVGWLGYWLQLRHATPRLAYQWRSTAIVTGDVEKDDRDIQIQYRGRRVQRVTRTAVALWNPSGATFDKTDFVKGAPAYVSFEGGAILKPRVVRESREGIGFRVGFSPTADPPPVVWVFDVLDRRDGVLLEFLHSGGIVGPTFTGLIKGIPHGPENRGLLPELAPRSRWWWLRESGWPLFAATPVLFLIAAVTGVELELTRFG